MYEILKYIQIWQHLKFFIFCYFRRWKLLEYKKVIIIIFKTKRVGVLLGFSVFQHEKQAQKVPIFRKDLKKSPSPVTSLSTWHCFLSSRLGLLSPEAPASPVPSVSSPPWTSKNQTFLLGWLPSPFLAVLCFYWVEFQAQTHFFSD